MFDLPSRLADGLAAGRLDVALIPSIEYLQDPGYTIVSDACIACRGPVLSVKLLSRSRWPRSARWPWTKVRGPAPCWPGSCCDERYGLRPELLPLPIGQPLGRDAPADAVLLIGDRAIHPPAERASSSTGTWATQWCRWSELPFVFAMWVARAG